MRPDKTPYLVMNLELVEQSYRNFRNFLPWASVFYATKANPAPEILRLLARLGSGFDVASPAELDLCLAAGAIPSNLSYGNTIKKSADIAYAYQRGVRVFTFDCEQELDKLTQHAPGAKVICRLAVQSTGACWPLARKFGCSAAELERLLTLAKRRGLEPWGISFHVGSQQTDPNQWTAPIAETARIFASLRHRGIALSAINLGGGFPARYNSRVPPLAGYGRRIGEALRNHMGPFAPHVMIEPGRGLVADAGTLLTRVVLVTARGAEGPNWVYIDAGKFGGLAETMDECIQYRIRPAAKVPGRKTRVVLAGPTCDSADILYQRAHYSLPANLREGDTLEILSAGAYTATYASVGFNGFAPLATYFESRGGKRA